MMQDSEKEKITEIMLKDIQEWEKKYGKRKYAPEYLKRNGFFVDGKEPEWNFLEN